MPGLLTSLGKLHVLLETPGAIMRVVVWSGKPAGAHWSFVFSFKVRVLLKDTILERSSVSLL